MDIDARLKVLGRLAQSKTATARVALEKEIGQIANTLGTESEYDLLAQSLDVLDVIAYRVSERAVAVLDTFIQTIEARKLLHTRAESFFLRDIENYNNAQTLVGRAIEVLVHLRYYETQSILRILLRASNHPSERLRKKAIEGLSALAKYDLDVFYGPDRRGGIGPAPQQQIADQLESLGDSDLKTHYAAVLILVEGLLSPSIEGASWSSTSVMLSRGSTPALPSVAAVRERSIRMLRHLYAVAESKSQKLQIVGALHGATRTEQHGSLDQPTSDMIQRDATHVLTFYAELVQTEDLQIVQKIEHNSYWIFVHAHNEEIRAAARKIEKLLAAHAEYQIYRVLIGFEGIFGDWATLRRDDHNQWNVKEKNRRERASEFAKSITAETYPEWCTRILIYAQTESDDLATFPLFYQFLDEFAALHADLALKLINEHTEEIARFLIPLLRGLWDGSHKETTRSLVSRWIKEAQIGKRHQLFVSTKLFLSTKDCDVNLLTSLLDKAVEIGETPTIRQVVAVAVVRYPMTSSNVLALKQLLLRALDALTELNDAGWVYDAWFRDEARQLILELDSSDIEHVLRNLSALPKIDYHAEELLSRIAERFPERVIEFFRERISAESQEGVRQRRENFEAIPFEFHKLQQPLSKTPRATVKILLDHFCVDTKLFAFRGARLLRNIFPKISEEFEAELLELIREGGEKRYEFVLGILRKDRKSVV